MFDLTNPIYTDPNKAREYLEATHWPQGPVCPHCGGVDNIKKLEGKSTRPGVYKCNQCRKPFTVTVGTIFEDSKIPLNKWLLAFRLMASSKKGMSAHQLGRSLGITYKSAWFMAHRIREAMTQDNGPIGGSGSVVEADETYVGGKAANRAYGKPADKKIVLSLVERNGEVRSFHIANVNAKTLRPLFVKNVHRVSFLATDDASRFVGIGREFKSHAAVNHSKREYAADKTVGGLWDQASARVHTNTVENFFSIFKRDVIGTYHHISEAHMSRYTAEFDFRYNTRKIDDAERTALALKGAVGKRLTYRRPSGAAYA